MIQIKVSRYPRHTAPGQSVWKFFSILFGVADLRASRRYYVIGCPVFTRRSPTAYQGASTASPTGPERASTRRVLFFPAKVLSFPKPFTTFQAYLPSSSQHTPCFPPTSYTFSSFHCSFHSAASKPLPGVAPFMLCLHDSQLQTPSSDYSPTLSSNSIVHLFGDNKAGGSGSFFTSAPVIRKSWKLT